MKIGNFLKQFRYGVKEQNNGTQLSVSALAKILGIKADTIRNSEKGSIPSIDVERNKIKTYFQIDNVEDIPEEKLDEAIKRFDFKKELSDIHNEIKESSLKNNNKNKRINKNSVDLRESNPNDVIRENKKLKEMLAAKEETIDAMKKTIELLESMTGMSGKSSAS